MPSLINYSQQKGLNGCIFYTGIGLLVTTIVTLVGYVGYWIGGWATMISLLCFWQPNLLVMFYGIGIGVEGRSSYPGIPYMILWLLGILSGIPIYTFLGYLSSYLKENRS